MDGSFELSNDTLPYKWTNYTGTVKVADETLEAGESGMSVIDGSRCYHITGQPGKDKFLKFTTNLGDVKNSYTLSGWVKTVNVTPIRSGRVFQAKAYHVEEEDDGTELEYTAKWTSLCPTMVRQSLMISLAAP